MPGQELTAHAGPLAPGGPHTVNGLAPGGRRECGHWIGPQQRFCRAGDDLRAYLSGLRCPLHTPAALTGRKEPGTKPGLPPEARTTCSAPLAPVSPPPRE